MNALDPNLMTADERLDEVARILAAGIHRWMDKKKPKIIGKTEKVILDKPPLLPPYGSQTNPKKGEP